MQENICIILGEAKFLEWQNKKYEEKDFNKTYKHKRYNKSNWFINDKWKNCKKLTELISLMFK